MKNIAKESSPKARRFIRTEPVAATFVASAVVISGFMSGYNSNIGERQTDASSSNLVDTSFMAKVAFIGNLDMNLQIASWNIPYNSTKARTEAMTAGVDISGCDKALNTRFDNSQELNNERQDLERLMLQAYTMKDNKLTKVDIDGAHCQEFTISVPEKVTVQGPLATIPMEEEEKGIFGYSTPGLDATFSVRDLEYIG